MNMGIITLCFNDGGFLSMYSFWFLPHNYEGNLVQFYSDYHLVVVYFSRWAYSHGLGIKVSHKSILGWPLCQYICYMVVG
jgi:hypothetical protein